MSVLPFELRGSSRVSMSVSHVSACSYRASGWIIGAKKAAKKQNRRKTDHSARF